MTAVGFTVKVKVRKKKEQIISNKFYLQFFFIKQGRAYSRLLKVQNYREQLTGPLTKTIRVQNRRNRTLIIGHRRFPPKLPLSPR